MNLRGSTPPHCARGQTDRSAVGASLLSTQDKLCKNDCHLSIVFGGSRESWGKESSGDLELFGEAHKHRVAQDECLKVGVEECSPSGVTEW
jgi:hypothetical protein